MFPALVASHLQPHRPHDSCAFAHQLVSLAEDDEIGSTRLPHFRRAPVDSQEFTVKLSRQCSLYHRIISLVHRPVSKLG